MNGLSRFRGDSAPKTGANAVLAIGLVQYCRKLASVLDNQLRRWHHGVTFLEPAQPS